MAFPESLAAFAAETSRRAAALGRACRRRPDSGPRWRARHAGAGAIASGQWARFASAARRPMAPGRGTHRSHAPRRRPPRAGEWWVLRGPLVRPTGQRNPGGFDRARHAERRGIAGIVRVEQAAAARCLSSGPRAGLRPDLAVARVLGTLRARAHGLLQAHLKPDAAGLAEAMAVGPRASLVSETVTAFRWLGWSHLVAVSGLNVGFVAALVGAAAGVLPDPPHRVGDGAGARALRRGFRRGAAGRPRDGDGLSRPRVARRRAHPGELARPLLECAPLPRRAPGVALRPELSPLLRRAGGDGAPHTGDRLVRSVARLPAREPLRTLDRTAARRRLRGPARLPADPGGRVPLVEPVGSASPVRSSFRCPRSSFARRSSPSSSAAWRRSDTCPRFRISSWGALRSSGRSSSLSDGWGPPISAGLGPWGLRAR